jgi:hypothetical protein
MAQNPGPEGRAWPPLRSRVAHKVKVVPQPRRTNFDGSGLRWRAIQLTAERCGSVSRPAVWAVTHRGYVR